MNGEELQHYLDDKEELQPIVLIETPQYGRAVVVRLGEGVGGPWGSGHILAFWTNGDHSCLDDLEDIKIINENSYQ